jgi:hypothetical protein
LNPIPGHKKERAAQTWCRRRRGQPLASSKFFRPDLPSHAHVGKAPKIPIEQIKKNPTAGISLPQTGFVRKKKLTKEPSFVENLGARDVESRPPRTCLKNC